ncbi:fimbrial protein [Pantoea osteomyelitidis]|uniref:Fimbrial protein n=1 Tax=Pantoea osteomyelitidis TaxID=3230026 RepID=A0ABW7Q2H5_9GAMM
MCSLTDMVRKRFNYCCAFFLALNLNPVWSETKCKDDQCNVIVNFSGKYLEETCEVDINGNGNEDTITLPTILTSSLNNDGDEAGHTPFSVSLSNCPYSRTVALYFKTGSAGSDARTGNLLNSQGSDYAKNVQIRLRKQDASVIKVDKLETMQRYNISASGETVKHSYTASYYANGNLKATAGEVETQAEIDLIYE